MEIPSEFKNDPEAVELFKIAYRIILKKMELRKMSSEKRKIWAMGFINGIMYQQRKDKK